MSLIPVTLLSFERSPLQPKAYNHSYRDDNHCSNDTIINAIYNCQLDGSTLYKFNCNDTSANWEKHVVNGIINQWINYWINQRGGHVDNTSGHLDNTGSDDVCVVSHPSEIYAKKSFKCR